VLLGPPSSASEVGITPALTLDARVEILAVLEPEEVDSFDLSLEWYFAPAAVASIGYFYKERTNIFGIDFEGAALVPDPSLPGGLARETDPSCPGGGIYNPIVIPNILGDPEQLGMCVDFTIPGNDPDTTEVSGFELAFQYDFSELEHKLGWASGFGIIARHNIPLYFLPSSHSLFRVTLHLLTIPGNG